MMVASDATSTVANSIRTSIQQIILYVIAKAEIEFAYIQDMVYTMEY